MLHLLTALIPLLLGAPPGTDEDAPPPAVAAPEGRGEPALVARFAELLGDPLLKGAKASIAVRRVGGGPWLLAFDADQRLHPASNAKIVTTATALVELGPGYQYRTDLAADTLEGGVAGNLYLVGRGDPRFVSEDLWVLVEDARESGLVKVKGDLVVDDTWFTKERTPPGYADKKDDDAAYRAPTGAMSLNFNSVTVRLLPGAKAGAKPRVRVRPDSGYLKVVNDATTTRGGKERLTAHASAEGDGTKLVVGGRIPVGHRGLVIRRRIDNPPRFAGLALREMLKRAGIKVEGKVRVGKAPGKRRRLARHMSPPLASLVGDINKLSNNFMAEHVVRTLGAEKGKSADWKGGLAVVRRFLEKQVKLEGPFRQANGSGLFGDTAFSARQMVEVLRYMHNVSPPLPEFAASLAIGGVDGTLRKRVRGLPRGVVRAKTGTLNGVVCLSGYVTLGDGSLAAFSILMNDVKGRAWKVWKVQDEMAKALAAFGSPERSSKK